MSELRKGPESGSRARDRSRSRKARMYEDDEEMEINSLGLSVFGDIMLVLFIGLLVTTTVTVNRKVIENPPMGGAKGEEAPSIGLEVAVGPGKTISIDGESVTIDKMLKLAGKVPQEDRVQVRQHPEGDPSLYWNVRWALRKIGCGFLEAPPGETTIHEGRGK